MRKGYWVVILLVVAASGLFYVQRQGRTGITGTCPIPTGGGTCTGTPSLVLPENTSYASLRLNLTPHVAIGDPVSPTVIVSPVVVDDSDAGQPGGSPFFSKEPPQEHTPAEPAPIGNRPRMALLGLRKQLYLFNATDLMMEPDHVTLTVHVSATSATDTFPHITVILYRVTHPYVGGWTSCTKTACTGNELWNLSGNSGAPLNLQPLAGATLFNGARVDPGTTHSQDLVVTLNTSQLFSPLDQTAFVVAYTMSVASVPGGQEPTVTLTAWPTLTPADVVPHIGDTPTTMQPGPQPSPFQTDDVASPTNTFCGRPLLLAPCPIPITIDATVGGSFDYVEDSVLVPEACRSAWNCTDWTPCENNLQTRDCVDLRGCYPQTNIPSTEQDCTPPGPDCHDQHECTGLNQAFCADNQTIQTCTQVNSSCLAWVNTTCGDQSVCIDEVLAISGTCYYYGPPLPSGGGGGGGGGYTPPAPAKACPGPGCPALSLNWITSLPTAFPWVLLIGATGVAWYIQKRRRKGR